MVIFLAEADLVAGLSTGVLLEFCGRATAADVVICRGTLSAKMAQREAKAHRLTSTSPRVMYVICWRVVMGSS